MKWIKRLAIAVATIALVIQVLPVGRPRSNPPATNPLAWPDSTTRELFDRACGDCHSNDTRWPWYSHVAPFKWLILEHVRNGRTTFNVSSWKERHAEEAREAVETIEKGSMPPANYLRWHEEARLTDVERERLIAGLRRMQEFREAP